MGGGVEKKIIRDKCLASYKIAELPVSTVNNIGLHTGTLYFGAYNGQ